MYTTGMGARITGKFNNINTDAKYVGYMYGGAEGVASTQRNGDTSEAATYNETNSNAKNQLDAWNQINITGKSFENQIVDNIFCNDRQLQSEVGGVATGLGYGTNSTAYAGYYRLYTNKIPTLKCNLINDRFTLNKTLGNGALTYPIGLISADEALMAGLAYGIENKTNFLNISSAYFTATPWGYSIGTTAARNIIVSSSGTLTHDSTADPNTHLRPVINLDSEIAVSGDGSATNPFRIIN